jgi:hypothetical protein
MVSLIRCSRYFLGQIIGGRQQRGVAQQSQRPGEPNEGALFVESPPDESKPTQRLVPDCGKVLPRSRHGSTSGADFPWSSVADATLVPQVIHILCTMCNCLVRTPRRAVARGRTISPTRAANPLRVRGPGAEEHLASGDGTTIVGCSSDATGLDTTSAVDNPRVGVLQVVTVSLTRELTWPYRVTLDGRSLSHARAPASGCFGSGWCRGAGRGVSHPAGMTSLLRRSGCLW